MTHNHTANTTPMPHRRVGTAHHAVWMLVLLCSLFGNAVAAAESASTPSAEDIARLAAEVSMAEDISAIKKLQKTYGYYLDNGMWADLAILFTEDAVAHFPEGVYAGRDSIREYLYRNVGGNVGRDVEQPGLGDGRLYNHIILQPVVHLDPGAETARGRWRAMTMMGTWGSAAGTWAEGVYNLRYRKEAGSWKIASLDYHAGFNDSYATGWRASSEANTPVFFYDNPGTSGDRHVWPVPEMPTPEQVSSETPGSERAVAQDIAQLLAGAQRLQDEVQLENLQRIYGYYLDRAQWDQLAQLFAEDGTVEYGQMGVYQGPERIRQFFGLFGAPGLEDGWLFDHLQLQTLVHVSADGNTAWVRSREWGMTGHYEGEGQWSSGIYENTFVKENATWKFQSLHYYPTFISDYDEGWTQDAQPAPALTTALAPDAAPTEVYGIYPEAHVPAYHYPNPVSGEWPRYPEQGAPTAASIAARQMPDSAFQAPPVDDPAAALAKAQTLLQRVKDHHEIENLENAYGYYLDKNLWHDLANLFAENGSMELAQRGVYQGRERVRAFLFNVFGDEGPVAGRLGNHLHMQPVIHVSDDGQRAQVRSRMLQQLNFSGSASMGAAIYVNELVKEDGAWKFLSTHAFNTFTAAYDGGWMRSPGRRLPMASETFPPDAPPTVEFNMFPSVYDIPYHYPNPVTGM